MMMQLPDNLIGKRTSRGACVLFIIFTDQLRKSRSKKAEDDFQMDMQRYWNITRCEQMSFAPLQNKEGLRWRGYVQIYLKPCVGL